MIDSKFILYGEDDCHYATLLEAIFKQAGLPHRLRIVPNGKEIVAYLRGDGKYSNRFAYPLPGLVLLDLKMPVMNGFETLNWIRKHSANPQQPVVVLTCSDDLGDIKKAYELGANSFLTKPPNVEDLLNMVRTLENYWLNQNASPPLKDTPARKPSSDTKTEAPDHSRHSGNLSGMDDTRPRTGSPAIERAQREASSQSTNP